MIVDLMYKVALSPHMDIMKIVEQNIWPRIQVLTMYIKSNKPITSLDVR